MILFGLIALVIDLAISGSYAVPVSSSVSFAETSSRSHEINDTGSHLLLQQIKNATLTPKAFDQSHLSRSLDRRLHVPEGECNSVQIRLLQNWLHIATRLCEMAVDALVSGDTEFNAPFIRYFRPGRRNPIEDMKMIAIRRYVRPCSIFTSHGWLCPSFILRRELKVTCQNQDTMR